MPHCTILLGEFLNVMIAMGALVFLEYYVTATGLGSLDASFHSNSHLAKGGAETQRGEVTPQGHTAWR